jgi:serine/threonine-protein kinase
MEKRPAGSKPAKPAKPSKPAAAPGQDRDTVDNLARTVGPDDQAQMAALGATEVFGPTIEEDAEAEAARFLSDEPAPAPVVHKPAGKPKPPPAPSRKTDEIPKPEIPDEATELGQTAAFAPAPARNATPGEQTEVFDSPPANPTQTPTKPVGSTRTPGAAKGATQAPASSAKGSEGSSGLKATVLGEYRLLKKLGQGGMGTVYLAQQESLDRKVALKVLSKELAAKPAFVERFKREAKLMAKLDHPNILRCFGAGEVAGHHYLAMEFVEGGSVESWLKRLGKFELGDAMHITIACARALEHAHGLTMVHRDIKPDNLLLTGKGIVKLADLGLAKAQDDDLSLTKTGTGAGTPLYMAPEQARDVKNVDGRTDIYAMGCMLYCFLTGQLPFTGETLIEVIDAKTKGKFTPARRLEPDIPPRLDLIIDKMIAPSPSVRYQTCAELLADLEGLGVASPSLGFLKKPAEPTAPTMLPKSKGVTQTPGRVAERTSVPSSPAARTRVEEPREEPEGWFMILPLPGGKTMAQKVEREEMAGLVKTGVLTADTMVARSAKGKPRSASTYPEVNQIIVAGTAKTVADRKTAKYRELYAEIDQEAERHKRAKFWKNLKAKVGGFAGFVIWMFIVAAIIAGGIWLVLHFMKE